MYYHLCCLFSCSI